MEIRPMNNISFTNANPIAMKSSEQMLGQKILENTRNIDKLKELETSARKAPLYLKAAASVMKKMAPGVEKRILNKCSFEDVVNVGNVGKELVAMVVYPAQVLSNPDIPKDKRRFVGIYDFFVTCFSLAGTVLFAWKGTELSGKCAEKLMKKKYMSNIAKYPMAPRVAKGGAFVLGIAVQTILFKRILAPALAPPLAAAARRKMEANDAKKAAKEQNKSADLLPTGTSIAVDQNKNKITK